MSRTQSTTPTTDKSFNELDRTSQLILEAHERGHYHPNVDGVKALSKSTGDIHVVTLAAREGITVSKSTVKRRRLELFPNFPHVPPVLRASAAESVRKAKAAERGETEESEGVDVSEEMRKARREGDSPLTAANKAFDAIAVEPAEESNTAKALNITMHIETDSTPEVIAEAVDAIAEAIEAEDAEELEAPVNPFAPADQLEPAIKQDILTNPTTPDVALELEDEARFLALPVERRHLVSVGRAILQGSVIQVGDVTTIKLNKKTQGYMGDDGIRSSCKLSITIKPNRKTVLQHGMLKYLTVYDSFEGTPEELVDYIAQDLMMALRADKVVVKAGTTVRGVDFIAESVRPVPDTSPA